MTVLGNKESESSHTSTNVFCYAFKQFKHVWSSFRHQSDGCVADVIGSLLYDLSKRRIKALIS